MHHLYFVVTPKGDEDYQSDQVRQYVNSWLQEEGFCSQGFYSHGKAEWFVLGGRWSGLLTEIDMEENERNQYDELGHEDDAQIITQEIIDTLGSIPDFREVGYVNTDTREEGVVSEMLTIPEEYIGKYWIVVVDYHS